MKWTQPQREFGKRGTALVVGAAMIFPTLAGCGGNSTPPDTSPPPPPGFNGTRQGGTRPMGQATHQGLTGKQKVMLVAGAAALYYLYRRHQKAQQAAGPNGKYFISQSTGRVYYRDLKTGKFQWVSPPQGQIQIQPGQVSQSELQQMQQYQGFNGSSSGQPFGGYGGQNARNYSDAVPAQDING